MEMEYWCEFAVVSQRKSFSKAAEEMNISQSSLSKHIMSLEKELGVRLFERSSRRVELSEAGKQLLPMALQVQNQLKKIHLLAEQQQRLNRTTVSIASIPVMAQYGITDAIADFQRSCPEAVLEVEECESMDIMSKLLSGDCELAFSRDISDRDGMLDSLVFCRDYLVAVLPLEHPLAHFSTITPEMLKDEQFLLMDSGTSLYNLCMDVCRQAGFTPKVCYTGHRPENIVGLVASGMGISLLMKGHTEYVKNGSVVTVPVSPQITSTICLICPADRKLSKYAKLFWKFIAK